MSNIVTLFQGPPKHGSLISPGLTTYGALTRINCVPHLAFTPGRGEVYKLSAILVSNTSDVVAYVSIVTAQSTMTRQSNDVFGNPTLMFGSSLTPVSQIAWGRPIPLGGGTTAIEPGGAEVRGAGPQGTPVGNALWLGALPGASFDGDGSVMVTVMAERRA